MENAENLILEHLRAIQAHVAGIREDIQKVKQRLSGVKAGVGDLKRDKRDLYTENAIQYVRYDHLASKIEKIERRLELNTS